MNEAKDKRFYSSREVAILCNRDIRTITRLAPKYATCMVGHTWLWSPEAIANYKGHQRSPKGTRKPRNSRKEEE